MKKGKNIACVITIFLSVFMTAVTTQSMQTPQVTFIPSKLSVNSSFIMIANPQASPGEMVRVMWFVGGTYDYGLFPKIGNKWICYFSDTDSAATCGPGLFKEKGHYDIVVVAKNQYGEVTNESEGQIDINVGGISLQTDININGNNVTMVVYSSSLVKGISYTVYDAEGKAVQGKSGSLEKKVYSYTGYVTLDEGVYYIAFEAESSDGTDNGGTLVKVVTGGYEPTGNYRLVSDPVVWSTLIESGSSKQKSNFRITNTGTGPAKNLAVSIPSELSNYIDVLFPKTELNSSESMYFTFMLKHISHSMEIKTNIDVLSDGFKVGEIPVNVIVSVINESSGSYSCEGKSDLSDCIGGICCDGVCRKRATCCTSSDCVSGETCENFVCKPLSTPPQTGECEGRIDGSMCTEGGSSGICCDEKCIIGGECCKGTDCGTGESCIDHKCETSVSENECEGAVDGSSCSIGYCYNGECVECFENYHCELNETCNTITHACEESSGGSGGGISITTILIIALVVVGGIGAYLYIREMKKKSGEGSEYSEEEEINEEEFY